ncbi:MAG: phosphomannomutase/phosphoglucomutase [Pseudomonadota bacterium]
MFKDHIFREYDIRGVYNSDFDNDFAHDLGFAYAHFLRAHSDDTNPVVSVGYDARLSSPNIVDALTEGFLKGGAKVFNLGLITTPMSYFSMFQLGLTGGIMVTGSHNPPEYNGFKLSLGRTTIFGHQIQALREAMTGNPQSTPKGNLESFDISGDYVSRYKEEFKDVKPVPVVLDCGNGAAGAIVRRMYESIGFNPEILFEKPDGTFPNHHPDPTVEHNTEDMKKAVAKTGAACGIGFDGDADRIGLVDEKGRFVLGDEIMMIVARDILNDIPGSKIIGDVKCSDRLYDDIQKYGGQPIMWKTGHSLIKNKIKQEKAPFGGELSGHIFFSDRNYGYDDAPYAGLRLLEIIGKTGKTIDQLLEGIPKSYSTPEIRTETTEENKVVLVKKLQDHFSKPSEAYTVNTIDGVRVSYKDGWALVRSSNTQPVITIRYESHTPEGLERIQTEMTELINPLL